MVPAHKTNFGSCLDTINGGSVGDVIHLRSGDSSKVPTLKNGTGNIRCGFDIALQSSRDTATFVKHATDGWHLVGFANNTSVINLGSQAAQPASGTVTLSDWRYDYPYFSLSFTFAAARVTVTDAGGSGSSGSLKIWDFGGGAIKMLASRHNWTAFAEGAALTGGAGDASFVIAFGSAAANAGDGALTGTEIDWGGTQTITLSGGTGTGATLLTDQQTPLDGTATALDIYLNWSGTAATIDANSTIDCTGTYTIVGLFVGDD
jgi:hypothetical protein